VRQQQQHCLQATLHCAGCCCRHCCWDVGCWWHSRQRATPALAGWLLLLLRCLQHLGLECQALQLLLCLLVCCRLCGVTAWV
jgi:hypothetical protein